MKSLRIHISVAVLVLLGLTVATEAAAREVYNISSGWTFFTADDPSTDNSSVVNLPHIQTSTGTVNYLKELDVPAAWEGRRVFLRVGGAARVADIFVGGIHTATHRGAGSPFTVEITDRLRPGTPASIRIVVGSAPDLDVLPTAGSEKVYGGIFRGVEVIVCEPLSVSPAASLPSPPSAAPSSDASLAPVVEGPAYKGCEGGDGIWITTDRLTRESAEGRVRLSLLIPPATTATPTRTTTAATPTRTTTAATSATPASRATLATSTSPASPATLDGALARVRFSDAEGNLVAQSSLPVTSPELSIPFTLADPHLWQGAEDPYLYNVEVTLTGADGVRTDSLTVTTGFRTVAIDRSNNFTLNGRPTRLHGVILHRDRMVVGTALTPFQIEEDIDFILEMGANAVRVAGGPHSDYFYQLCDEAGLLVWNDGPFTGAAYPTDIDFVDTEAFRENGRLQFTEMISGLYNHPSVVAWGVFSNVTARTGDPVPYIRELNSLAHLLDPNRLTAASSVSDGDINFITDIVSFDLSLGWESGLPDGVVPWLAQLRKGWPNLRAGISYAAGASIFHQSERLQRPSPTEGFHPEGWQTFFHQEYMRYAVDAPSLWGVFVGNMFDSGAAKVASGASAGSTAGFPTGSQAGGIDDRGLVTFDRKDRKDAFWLYKAGWNHTEPFVRIAGSRLDTRVERRQTIRVFSNLPEVELFVGGRSQGRRTGERGIFVWENLGLRTGVNRIEARATGTIAGSDGGSGASGSSGSGVAGASGSGVAAGSASGSGSGSAGSSGAGSGSGGIGSGSSSSGNSGSTAGTGTVGAGNTGSGAGSSMGSGVAAGSDSGMGSGMGSGANTGPAAATHRITINIYPAAVTISQPVTSITTTTSSVATAASVPSTTTSVTATPPSVAPPPTVLTPTPQATLSAQ